MAVEAPDQYVAAAKCNLHEHPAIVRMWNRNNIIRRRAGLRAHRLNPELVKAAQYHAVYMARTGDFNHYTNFGPQGRAQRYGYHGFVSENIAMGQGNVDSAFSAWVNSGGHWANLSSGTLDCGFGYARSKNGTPYWVAVYANPSSPPKIVRAQNESSQAESTEGESTQSE